MIVMPMNPERRRRRNRVPQREWVVQTLEIALVWLRSRGGPTWFDLTFAGAAALGKPVLVMIRVLEKRRFRNPLD
jgi:hypothetical protein